MNKKIALLEFFLAAVYSLFPAPTAQAQDESSTPEVSSEVLVGEGISGYMDKKRRNPIVSVRTVSKAEGVEILADAYVKNGDFETAPIQFQFFVNRQLFATQLRSVELPGPVGVTVGANVAIPPFNYSVVATTLHPNRTFITIIHGAVFPTDLVAVLDCQLALTDTEGVTTTYEALEITSGQTGSDTLSLTLTDAANIDDSSDTVSATATVTIVDSLATGTLVTTKGDATLTHDITGTATKTDGKVSELAVTSTDGLAALSCVTSGTDTSSEESESSEESTDESESSEAALQDFFGK